jgi:folate-binding protein YgfZ
VDLLIPAEALGAVFDRLLDGGAAPVGFAALEVSAWSAALRASGWTWTRRPSHSRRNLQRALHYQKGCYIGQEVIARATFRGHMNRHLVGLRFGGRSPLTGPSCWSVSGGWAG